MKVSCIFLHFCVFTVLCLSLSIIRYCILFCILLANEWSNKKPHICGAKKKLMTSNKYDSIENGMRRIFPLRSLAINTNIAFRLCYKIVIDLYVSSNNNNKKKSRFFSLLDHWNRICNWFFLQMWSHSAVKCIEFNSIYIEWIKSDAFSISILNFHIDCIYGVFKEIVAVQSINHFQLDKYLFVIAFIARKNDNDGNILLNVNVWRAWKSKCKC